MKEREEKECRLEIKETAIFTKWKERDNENRKGKITVKKTKTKHVRNERLKWCRKDRITKA